MIVDLERRGDKQMFITEQVESIKATKQGGWMVRFTTSPRPFQYNKARLLYLRDPEVINIVDRGLYVRNKRITDIVEHQRLYRVPGWAGSLRHPHPNRSGGRLHLGLSEETR